MNYKIVKKRNRIIEKNQMKQEKIVKTIKETLLKNHRSATNISVIFILTVFICFSSIITAQPEFARYSAFAFWWFPVA